MRQQHQTPANSAPTHIHSSVEACEEETTISGSPSRRIRLNSENPIDNNDAVSNHTDAASSAISPCRLDTTTSTTNGDLSSTTAASPYRSLPATPSYALQYSSGCSNSLSRNKLRTISSPSLRQFSPHSPHSETQSSSNATTRLLGIPFPLTSSSPSSQQFHSAPHYHNDFDSYFAIGGSPLATLNHTIPQHSALNPLDSAVTIETSNTEQQHKHDEQHTQKVCLPIVFLGFLNIFLDTALSSSVIPILPRELKQDEFHEAIIIGSAAVTATLLGPICGWLSDDRGWGPILIWFYPLVFTSAVLMMSARKSFWKFLVARFIAGAGSGFMYPSNFSMVVSTHDPALRSTAVGFMLAGDMGSLAGPILAGYLYDIGGLTLTFSVLIAFSLFVTIVFFLVLPSFSPSTRFFGYFHTLFGHTAQSSSQTNHQQPSQLPSTHDLSQPFLLSAPPHPPLYKSLSDAAHPKILPQTPSAASTRDQESDARSLPGGHSPRPIRTSSFSMPFSHSSPPPPYLYNLHLQEPATMRLTTTREQKERRLRDVALVAPSRTATYRQAGVFGKLRIMLDEFKVFSTVPFLSRCAALFYCWGLAVSLQAILPIIWDRQYNISPSSIGILFAPHLILRVSVSAFFPFFSDVTSTPLRTLISLGLLVCTVSVAVLASLPSTVTPTVHSIVVAFLGLGLGLTDSCVTAWAGLTDFENPLAPPSTTFNTNNNHNNRRDSSRNDDLAPGDPNASQSYNSTTRGSSTRDVISSEAYRGRAFALLALACDTGMFTVPLIASILSEYLAFNLAFGFLSLVGVVILCLSLYSGWIEAIGVVPPIEPSSHDEFKNEECPRQNDHPNDRHHQFGSDRHESSNNKDDNVDAIMSVQQPSIPSFITVD